MKNHILVTFSITDVDESNRLDEIQKWIQSQLRECPYGKIQLPIVVGPVKEGKRD